jgi:hypothetical protein
MISASHIGRMAAAGLVLAVKLLRHLQQVYDVDRIYAIAGQVCFNVGNFSISSEAASTQCDTRSGSNAG